MAESKPQTAGPFRIDIQPAADRVVVALHGELDIATAPQVDADVAEAREANPGSTVVLDLRGITFIDSSGLRVLLRIREAAEAEGFGFTLIDGNGPVRRLLALTNLAGRFDYVEA